MDRTDLTLAARTDTPVLIVGATGGDRRRIAADVHARGVRRRGPFIEVSAERPFVRLSTALVLARGGTLFIDDVERLAPGRQRRLLEWFDAASRGLVETPTARARVIAGGTLTLATDVASRQFSEPLFYRLNTIRIDAAPSVSQEGRPMTVSEVMSTPVHTCQPDTDLAQVAHVMWEHDCGFVPVVDAGGLVVGVITDRDICIATATRRLLPEHMSAGQTMARSLHACLPDDGLDAALSAMKQAQVRRLPVVDARGHLVGVLSMNDIVRAAGRRGGPAASAVVGTLSGICAPRRVETAVA